VPLMHEPVSRSRITYKVEHRDSIQDQRLSRTRNPRNQRGRKYIFVELANPSTKVGEKMVLSG
jgi:hypothetical protein